MQTNRPAVTLSHNQGGSATLYAQGAHLTQWQSARGKDWVFTSREAVYAEGQPIRGGVPIIFPQFNERGPGPRHGFARTVPWRLHQNPEQTDQCTLTLESDAASEALWPHRFQAAFRVQLLPSSLRMELSVTNTDDSPFSFTAALHTYLAIEDLYRTRVTGLAQGTYWDNGRPLDERLESPADLLEFDGAIDRVYFDAPAPVLLQDGDRRLQVEQTGFNDRVVWNPGRDGAARMRDMANDEYARMLCIEAAAIGRAVALAPGQTWTGSQSLREI